MLDAELAEDIRRNMFVFEDITKLPMQAIQRVLKEVDQQDIAIALMGATEAKNFIMSNLSKRLQEMIEDDLRLWAHAPA